MTFLDDFHGWLDFAVYKLFLHIAVRLTISKWEDIKTLRSNAVITWNVCQKNDNPVCLNLLSPIWPYEPLCVTSSILIISALYKYVNEWNTVLLNKSDSDFTNTDRQYLNGDLGFYWHCFINGFNVLSLLCSQISGPF